MRALLLVVFCLMCNEQLSQLAANDFQDGLKSGQQAHSYVAAHFATGYWSKKGDKFLCPVVGDVEQTKFAIYVKEPNAAAMTLAVSLDRTMRKFPQLNRSYLIVSPENRNEPVTDDELALYLKQLTELGEQHGIEKLSLGYLQFSTAVSRWKNSLGFFETADVIVAVIEPGITSPTKNEIRGNRLPTRTVKPFYRFAIRLNSKELDATMADKIISDALSSLAN